MRKYAFALMFGCVSLLGCAHTSEHKLAQVQQHIQQVKHTQGFQEQRLQTESFTLYGLLRPARHDSITLHVYIEGDGLAWVRRNQISSDPTPTESTALNLAKHDPSSAAVLYLARPCQYIKNDNDLCSKKYWTSHRFAPEVVRASNEAIDTVKRQVNAENVVLIGYSGGGTVAALVAAMRTDVVFLASAAGNLDVHAWTAWHKVSPLMGSQSPMHNAPALARIPQRHVSSFDDVIVPPLISKNFCAAMQRPDYCKQVADIKHGGDWYTVWDYTYNIHR